MFLDDNIHLSCQFSSTSPSHERELYSRVITNGLDILLWRILLNSCVLCWQEDSFVTRREKGRKPIWFRLRWITYLRERERDGSLWKSDITNNYSSTCQEQCRWGCTCARTEVCENNASCKRQASLLVLYALWQRILWRLLVDYS